MKYANRIHNKHDRRNSIRALLLMLALMTSLALPTLRPPVSQAQVSGTVVGWGSNSFGQITIPAGLTDVTAISAGVFHSLALKSDGTVVGWGDNGFGGNTATACTKLADFINECNAQSGKKLSVEQADELIARANDIRASLGCP